MSDSLEQVLSDYCSKNNFNLESTVSEDLVNEKSKKEIACKKDEVELKYKGESHTQQNFVSEDIYVKINGQMVFIIGYQKYDKGSTSVVTLEYENIEKVKPDIMKEIREYKSKNTTSNKSLRNPFMNLMRLFEKDEDEVVQYLALLMLPEFKEYNKIFENAKSYGRGITPNQLISGLDYFLKHADDYKKVYKF